MKARHGYTLLEVMLAIAIGLLLVAALYVAMDVQFRYMRTGREAIREGQLARGVLTRMATDIRLSMAALPQSGAAASSSTSGAASGSTSTSGSGSAQGTQGTGSSGTSGTTPASTDPSSQSTATAGESKYNLGMQGDSVQLTLYITGVPRYGLADVDQQNGTSDFRRVMYYVSPGGGLVRVESRRLADDDLLMEESPTILAPEVIGLQFRYFDASAGQWVDQWDGSTSGPPTAVEIVVTLQSQPEFVTAPATRTPQTYRLVVAIPSASFSADSSSTSQQSTTGSQPSSP